MTKQIKRLIVGLAIGVAAVVAVIAGPVLMDGMSAAKPEATDNVRVVDEHKLPEQWVINAAYGRGALSNLRAALGEIAKNNNEEAIKGIAVAQSLLSRIKRELPGSSVKAEAPRGKPADTDLILVHSEVRVLGDANADKSVETKLDDIRRKYEMNDHEAIIAALESLNIPLAYTRVDLPLGKTKQLVNQSLEALESHDAQRARSKLLEIGNELHVETVRVGMKEAPVKPDDAG